MSGWTSTSSTNTTTYGYSSYSTYFYDRGTSSDNYGINTKKLKERIIEEKTCFLFDPKGLDIDE